jgi:hypothetical protein
MDAAEFANIGAKLVMIGGQLNELKAERDELNTQIAKLEAEIRPLIAQHALMIAEIVGAPPPVVQAAPAYTPVGPGAASGATPAEAATLGPSARKKIIAFLDRCEPGVSALQIAEALSLDAVLVRQIMHEFATRGNSGGDE